MSFIDTLGNIARTGWNFLTGSSTGGALARSALLGFLLNRVSNSIRKDNDALAVTESTPIPDRGVRVRVDPDTNNPIPVVYGDAFLQGFVSDAEITNSNQTMWFCFTICEKTGDLQDGTPSEITFNEVYWDNLRLTFQSDGYTVGSAYDETGTEVTNYNGLVKIYPFSGSSINPVFFDGYTTGNTTHAYNLFPNWTSAKVMSDLIFCLVRVDYSAEKDVTGIGNITFKISNSLRKPGDVLYDYMTSSRYGAGLSADQINFNEPNAPTNTLEELNNDSDEYAEYTDERPYGVEFKANPVPASLQVRESASFYAPTGAEITDIINYQTALPQYTLDMRTIPGSVVDFGTLPAYMTATEVQTDVWTVSGLRSVTDWYKVRYPLITLPNETVGPKNFLATVTWTGGNIKSWYVFLEVQDLPLFTPTTNQVYTPPANTASTTGLFTLSGTPDLVDEGADPAILYTIDIYSEDYPDAINNMATTYPGGTFSYTNGVASFTGTQTECNLFLNAFQIDINADVDLTFTLRYDVDNDTNTETDTVNQTLTSTRTTYLDPYGAVERYSVDATAEAISQGPNITDLGYSGTEEYTMTISPSDLNAVDTIDYTYASTFYPLGDVLLSEVYATTASVDDKLRMSGDGNWAVFGLPDESTTGLGADDQKGYVYLLKKAADYSWSEAVKFRPASGVGYYDARFGQFVDISDDGTKIVVVANDDPANSGTTPDKVFTYTRSGDTVTEHSVIDSLVSSTQRFGMVRISGDGTVLFIASTNSVGTEIVVYDWVSNAWSLRGTFNHGVQYTSSQNVIGRNMEVNYDGSYFIVSHYDGGPNAYGRVEVWNWNGSTWTNQLQVNGVSTSSGVGYDCSISNDGSVIAFTESHGVAGNILYHDSARFRVYERTGSTWAQTQAWPLNAVNRGDRICLSGDGNYLFVGSVAERRISFWENAGDNTFDPMTNITDTTGDSALYFAYAFAVGNTGYDILSMYSTTNVEVASTDPAYKKFYLNPYRIDLYNSWNPTTKELTLYGTKSGINAAIDTIELDMASGYALDFDLLYDVTMPTNGSTVRNQPVLNRTRSSGSIVMNSYSNLSALPED